MKKRKSFTIEYPELFSEWDWDINNMHGINPYELTSGSNKVVAWKCKNGHSFSYSIYKRTIGRNCPYCAGRKLLKGQNDLLTRFPLIAAEWDYKKNDIVSPSDVTFNSRKVVSWKCQSCGHEWHSSVHSRTQDGSGCPKCATKKRGINRRLNSAKNNPLISNTTLMAEWDFEENEKHALYPEHFSQSSGIKVFWKCNNGHKWSAVVRDRVAGRGCPYCANKKVLAGYNDLATTHPELAKEWHPTLNGKLTPRDITAGSGKKIFWLCQSGHTFKATPLHRSGSNPTGCPICQNGRQTSFAEQAVYYYVKKLYPDAINRAVGIIDDKLELDIYIPSIRYAIEYDGMAWHKKEKLPIEQRKYQLCQQNGIKLIRLRENGIELCLDNADRSFGRKNLYLSKNLEPTIKQLLDFLSFQGHCSISVDIERDRYEIQQYLSNIKGSLAERFPDIASEWDYGANGGLTPYMFKPHSNQKIHWICSKCGRKYVATINSRTAGTGCSICGIKKNALARSLPVQMLDASTGQVLKNFESLSEASREMNISNSNISMVCKGVRSTAGGYKWRYK